VRKYKATAAAYRGAPHLGGFCPSPSKYLNKINAIFQVWQEWQDSNLQPPVLETGALAIELHSYIKDLAAANPRMLSSLLPNSVF
jgi:hypothetical protein